MTAEELLVMRRRKGLTQSQLSDAISFSRQAIIKWERGTHAIPENAALLIIKACEDDVPAKRESVREDDKWFEAYCQTRKQPGFDHAATVRWGLAHGWDFNDNVQRRIIAAFPKDFAHLLKPGE